jgi:transcriptional regulator with XRE-family HTH domain
VDLKHLGRRVATAIEATGMTQAQVAERVGCDPSKVSNLVRGVRARLDVEFLAAVAEALGTTVEALFAPDPPETPSELHEAFDAMRVFAETWRLAIETERERVANERLRIETAAAMRTAEIEQVEAVDAQARLVAREGERDAQRGMRLAMEALSRGLVGPRRAGNPRSSVSHPASRPGAAASR